jgi:hypothetical protein
MHRSRIILTSTFFGIALSLIGCHHPAPAPKDEGVPLDQQAIEQKVNGMKRVASGTNKTLTYKAPQFGQLYLYDETTGLDIYKGSIAKGETFLFAPASSRAAIDKQTIDLMRDTNEKDEYRLYFIPR